MNSDYRFTDKKTVRERESATLLCRNRSAFGHALVYRLVLLSLIEARTTNAWQVKTGAKPPINCRFSNRLVSLSRGFDANSVTGGGGRMDSADGPLARCHRYRASWRPPPPRNTNNHDNSRRRYCAFPFCRPGVERIADTSFSRNFRASPGACADLP